MAKHMKQTTKTTSRGTTQKRIAAAAVSVAFTGVVGAGAIAFSQTDATFDPSQFTSSYNRGAEDTEVGYRAQDSQVDSQANRHGENEEEKDAAVKEKEANDDAFSQAPINDRSGTTAYNVTDGAQGAIATATGGGQSGNAANAAPGAIEGNNGSTENGNGSNGGANGGGNGGVSGGGSVIYPANPTANSYKYLKEDPTPEKIPPNGDTTFFRPYNGSASFESVNSDEVVVSVAEGAFYRGQKLDAWTIFCGLDAYFSYGYFDLFYFNCDQSSFATYPYFRIDSWENTATGEKNPEYCPSADIAVNVSFRLSTDDEWVSRTVEIVPCESHVFVVGEPDASGNRDVVWSTAPVENEGVFLPINLFSVNAQEPFLRINGNIDDDGYLNALLQGWKEGDASVPYYYSVTPGRHVIIPGDVTPLDPAYRVHFQTYSIDENYRYNAESGNRNTCRLQTLVDVDESAIRENADGTTTLSVPQGVQAVDVFNDQTKRSSSASSVNTMEIPSSTLYVNVNSSVQVIDSYSVASDNPAYAATDKGILESKDGTEYIGVPYGMTQLDVPDGVRRVVVPDANAIETLVIHASSADDLPDIDLTKLQNCDIVVEDDALDAFIVRYADAIEESGTLSIASASNPECQMVFYNGVLQTEDSVFRVPESGIDTVLVQLPFRIEKGAFEGNSSTTTLVLDSAWGFIELEDGCLAGGNVQTIVCKNETMAAEIEQRKAAAGAPNATVVTLEGSREGFVYYTVEGKTTLLYDSDGAEEFDGTLINEEGETIFVNTIAPYAFAGDTSLKSVSFGESVSSIGRGAFENCENLQALFIGSSNTVDVGANALKGCTNLGFVASRASAVNFATSENPNEEMCTWYAPSDISGGYDGRFVRINNVNDFAVDRQDDGSLILYGCLGSETPDEASLLLGTPTVLNGTIELRSTTTEIFGPTSTVELNLLGAFENTMGDWSIDWSSAPNLRYIDSRAFAGSGISSVDINAPAIKFAIEESAFEGCANLAHVDITAKTLSIGSTAFANCAALQSASFIANEAPTSDDYHYLDKNNIGFGVFSGDTALVSLTVGSPVPQLVYPSPKIAYVFDGTVDASEEAARISLHVPEGEEQVYINAWVYNLLGYSDYSDYYNALEWDMIMDAFDTGIWPTEADVRARMAENLLEPENRLRKMLGLPTVESSTVIAPKPSDSNDEEA